MQKVVVIVAPEDSALQAAASMRDQNIGFLPVCDDDGHPIGVVTDRDLAVRVCAEGRDATATRVADIMSRDLVTCRPEDELDEAERRMSEEGKARILVTDAANYLLGVISLADVAWRDSNRHAAHTLRMIAQREYR